MEGVHITRSRRKSIELSIDDNLQIAVKAPLWVTDRAIDHFIAQKADWISRQKAAKAAYLQAHPPLIQLLQFFQQADPFLQVKVLFLLLF